jgi:AraC-like DNA-binding protein
MDRDAIENLLMPATYGRHLTRLFPPERLLADTGLTVADLNDDTRRITVKQALGYIRNTLALAPEPDWYLGWARALSDHFHGPVSTALMSAPSLGAGLDTFLHYFPGRIPYMHMQGRHEGTQFIAELCPLIDLNSATPLLIETPLIILHQYLDTVYAVDLTQAVIELAYPATAYADRYQCYFKCAVRFGAPRHALVVPAAWRELRNLGYEESIWAHAVAHCRATVASSTERTTLSRIQSSLNQAFGDTTRDRPLPTLEQVAAQLHLTSRTLIRHLQRMGTSYQQQSDLFLRARAAELLTNDCKKIKEIAAALGFADPANFGKAFKRWYGVSPGDYRRQRGAVSDQAPLADQYEGEIA